MRQLESVRPRERARSLLEVHRRQVEAQPDAPALRFLERGSWRTCSWREWEAQAHSLAAALPSLGLQRGDTVELIAASSVQWAVVDLAVQWAGGVLVPIYPSSTSEQVALLLEDCGASLALCQDAAQLAKDNGVAPGEGYGLSEAGGAVAIRRPGESSRPREGIWQAPWRSSRRLQRWPGAFRQTSMPSMPGWPRSRPSSARSTAS